MPGKKNRTLLEQSSPLCFFSSAVVGVNFNTLLADRRDLIFFEISTEFADYRSRIVTFLLGRQGNKDLTLKRSTPAAGFSEQELLLEGLYTWFDQTKKPTGRRLYDVLKNARCPEDLLSKYKKPFEVSVVSKAIPTQKVS